MPSFIRRARTGAIVPTGVFLKAYQLNPATRFSSHQISSIGLAHKHEHRSTALPLPRLLNKFEK